MAQTRAGQGLLYTTWPLICGCATSAWVEHAHLGLPGLCFLLKLVDAAGQLWCCLLCSWQTSTGAFRLILKCRNLLRCAKFGLSPTDVTQPCLGQPHHPIVLALTLPV